MRFLERIIGVCCLLLLCNLALSQFGTTPQVINFPKTEYNASNQNWSIDQDSTGTIFIANNKGLLIYNGAWQLYELPGQQILRAVACDKNGRIYTGAFGEFGYWQKENLGNYTYHSLTKLITYAQFPKEEIWKITLVGDKVYFQSFSTIYLFEKGKITPIVGPGNIMYAFPIHGKMYVQVLGKGLYELNGTSFSPVVTNPILQKDEVISIMEGHENTILIGTVHNGLYQYKDGLLTTFPGVINMILKSALINAAIRLTDSTLAIGTIQKGLYVLHDDGRILEHFDQQNGLQNNTILSLKKDRIGNLWTGLDRGLDQIVLQSPLRYFQDVKGEIGAVYATTFYNGRFYIGSNDGLYRYEPNVGFRNVAGINWQVWSLDILNGQLFCSHNAGITVLENDRVSNIPNMPGGWAIKVLRSNPHYALQGTYIGMSVFEKGEDDHYHFKAKIKGVETMPISDWEEDANGNILLKHAYKGISKIRFSPTYDSVIQTTKMDEKNGVAPDIQQNLSYWNGNVYVISSDGVRIWNEKKNLFEKVDALFGLYNAALQVKRIFPMPQNYFWVVKDDNQLIYIDKSNVHYPFFLKDFSLVGGYERVIPLDDNQSILCGETGFALFSANLLRKNPTSTPYVSSVFVNERDHFVPITLLGRNHHGNWQIHYENRAIKIVAGCSVYDRLMQYRFKISKQGENGYWSEWQNATSKVYSELSAGTYKVEIQTNVSSVPTYFEFTVLQPWYWTWWSKAIYIILILLSIGFIYNKIEQKHTRKILLKQEEMEKMLAMQKMQHENELLLLRKEKLEEEVQLKSEDLANSANELIKRKKLLNKLHVEIEKQREDKEQVPISPSMRKLSKELERQLKLDKEETHLFEHGFNTVHEQFFIKLLQVYPELTPQDLKLAAYLRMNLGTKEISPLLNITVRGVELKRYRLRKKMNLDEGINLNEFMMKF